MSAFRRRVRPAVRLNVLSRLRVDDRVTGMMTNVVTLERIESAVFS